jgi:hypothetical protein
MVLEKIVTPTWLQMLQSVTHSYSNYISFKLRIHLLCITSIDFVYIEFLL